MSMVETPRWGAPGSTVCNMIFLSLVGIGAGIAIWHAGHPIIGVIVGLAFGGGAGWVFIAQLLGMLRMAVGGKRARAEAREFNEAWTAATGRGPDSDARLAFRKWRNARRAYQSDMSAVHYLAELFNRVEERRVFVHGGAALVRRFPDGATFFRPEGFASTPNFGFPSDASRALTREQMANGEELWFPSYEARVREEDERMVGRMDDDKFQQWRQSLTHDQWAQVRALDDGEDMESWMVKTLVQTPGISSEAYFPSVASGPAAFPLPSDIYDYMHPDGPDDNM